VVAHIYLFGTAFRQYEYMKEALLPLMTKYKVNMYLNGHQHAMEYIQYPKQNHAEVVLDNMNCSSGQEFWFLPKQPQGNSITFNKSANILH
jgi:hypothetical protein